MKVITQYQCEICQVKYTSEEAALKCEARGTFDDTKYPIGLMYEYYHHSDFVGIFAIAEHRVEYNQQHGTSLVSWACRSPRYGSDSLGGERCGGNGFVFSDEEYTERWIKHHRITAEHVNGPEYKRMVEYLKSQGITPRYYDAFGNLVEI